MRAEPTLLAEITTLEARERELSTPSALRGLIEPGTDIADRWATTPMSTRREIARLLLTPDLIGQLHRCIDSPDDAPEPCISCRWCHRASMARLPHSG
jgi:hypothetical protein